jgi:para-aminobenzoate synthetase/4-amino-4-deoxychorismate lyase
MTEPFILLDDARPAGASAARLYRGPKEVVVARRAAEVAPALERIDALRQQGFDVVGYLAYEAGLALEEKLAPLADERSGAMGPLLWFGAFEGFEPIAAEDVPAWLAAEAQPGIAQIGPLEPQLSAGGYGAAFAALQDAIASGDIYQANLTFPLAGSFRGDPLALYAALRPAAGAGYGGVVFDGTHWLLSCSPELFFAERDGAAMVKPMKGTRPRGRSEAEDAALAAELTMSEKDRAENLMIVDLLRNDLSGSPNRAASGSKSPLRSRAIPRSIQMVSTVRARLRPGNGAVDMVRALFPCGSITGAPKIRAMELIDEVERDARGPYCGAIGRIDALLATLRSTWQSARCG